MGVLSGKVVLITGGGRGIGRETALLAAREGAQVIVNDVGCAPGGGDNDTSPAQSVVREIVAAGGEAFGNGADVADLAAVGAMVEEALDRFGALHAVISPAGILRDGMFHRMSEDDWDAVIAVHLRGSFNVARATIEHFRRQQEGAYVFFSSNAGLMGNVGQTNYAAAKMGIVGFSRVLALEGAVRNVRSNVIAPVAWTRLAATVPVKTEQHARAMQEMRDTLSPAQIAPLAVALAAPGGAAISGQVFMAQGNEVMLVSQPRPIGVVTQKGGWTASALIEHGFSGLDTEAYAVTPSDELFPMTGLR